jgi:predicted RNase H-related nuclease YkuK (DUF458 family)
LQTEIQIGKIRDFIQENKNCKVYLGADSQRIKKKRVKLATVVVVHYIDNDGIGRGAKVFPDITFDKIIDAKLSRPYNRMMKEVQLLTELYTRLEDILIERDFEIHLDISPDVSKGSNIAYGSAKGWVRGITGVEPICKPNAWCASCVADKYSK